MVRICILAMLFVMLLSCRGNRGRLQLIVIMPDTTEYILGGGPPHFVAVAVELSGFRESADVVGVFEAPGKTYRPYRYVAFTAGRTGHSGICQGEVGAADFQCSFRHLLRHLFTGQIVVLDGFRAHAQ